jgi:hypothetical protein
MPNLNSLYPSSLLSPPDLLFNPSKRLYLYNRNNSELQTISLRIQHIERSHKSRHFVKAVFGPRFSIMTGAAAVTTKRICVKYNDLLVLGILLAMNGFLD